MSSDEWWTEELKIPISGKTVDVYMPGDTVIKNLNYEKCILYIKETDIFFNSCLYGYHYRFSNGTYGVGDKICLDRYIFDHCVSFKNISKLNFKPCRTHPTNIDLFTKYKCGDTLYTYHYRTIKEGEVVQIHINFNLNRSKKDFRKTSYYLRINGTNDIYDINEDILYLDKCDVLKEKLKYDVKRL